MQKSTQPNGPAQFPKSKDLGPRVWGTETLLMEAPGFIMKHIKMNAGTKGGLQVHRAKDEAGYLVEGRVIVRFDPGTGEIVEKEFGPGAVFYFPPGCVHQVEAITDCWYIEASNPVYDDRVRMEEAYGLPSDIGLPSTEFPRFKP